MSAFPKKPLPSAPAAPQEINGKQNMTKSQDKPTIPKLDKINVTKKPKKKISLPSLSRRVKNSDSMKSPPQSRKSSKEKDKEKDKRKSSFTAMLSPRSRRRPKQESKFEISAPDGPPIDLTPPEKEENEKKEEKQELPPKPSPSHEEEKKIEIQSSISAPSEILSVEKPMEKKEEMIISKDPRENVVREIYETEKAYVQDLHIIVERFLKPIRDSELISNEEVNKLFSTVEMLLPLHQDLLKEIVRTPSVASILKDGTTPDRNYSIGNCFITMSQYLKMYSQYCTNQEAAINLYNVLIKNKAFDDLVFELCSHPECKRLDLPAYLIKPMQRVCKYPLLLRELVKQTPANHSDYAKLTSALELISKTVSVINESKKIHEESETLYSIQHKVVYPKKFPSISYPIIAPTRKYLEQGTCIYISRKFTSSTVKWYLFNDLLLLTTARNVLKKYVPTNSALIGHVQLQEFDYAFEIIHCGCDKIWLACKKQADYETLKQKFEGAGMISRFGEYEKEQQKSITAAKLVSEYANRPMPIPPGKFTQSFGGKVVDDVIPLVESLASKPLSSKPLPSTPPQATTAAKKRSSTITVSSPSHFRRGPKS